MKLKDAIEKQNKQFQEEMNDNVKSINKKSGLRKFGSMVIGIMGLSTLFTMPGFGAAAMSAAMSLFHGTTNKVNKVNKENERLAAQMNNNNKIVSQGVKASPEANAARAKKIKAAENKLIDAENKLKKDKTKIGITNFLQVAELAAGAVFGAVPVVGWAIAGAAIGTVCLKHAFSIDAQRSEATYQTRLGEYNNLLIERNIVNQYSKRKGHAAGKQAADDLAMTYGKEKETTSPVVEETKEEVELEDIPEVEPSVDAIDVDYEVVEEKIEDKQVKDKNEDLVDAYLKTIMEPTTYEQTTRGSK